MPRCDLAVVGAGAAGLSVTAVAAQLGLAVTLIERGRMGGDCLNVGCVPSKALLAAAHAAISAREAGRFGVHPGEPRVDWAAVRAHVRGVIDAIAPIDSQERFEGLGARVLRGSARFVGANALEVDGERIEARRIVIAAGGRPAVPTIPGLDRLAYLTNETIFDLVEQPSHLLILGGGPIGLEMAQAYAGLGCRVTVIEAGRVAANDDPELVDRLREILSGQNIAIIEGAKVVGAATGPTLTLADGRTIGGSHLLVAAGRRPNIEDLDLEAGGVRATEGGIATDRGLRSVSNRAVWAIGDIADPEGIGPRAFTHVAGYHAGIVIRRMLFHVPARVDYASLPRVTYTAPELAQVGMTEAEARAAGHQDIDVLRWELAENDRAQAERATRGLVKLVARRGRMLGAGILAPHAGEMIGQWGLAIATRAPLSTLAGMIMPYPTLAEAGKRAASSFYATRLFSQRTQRLVRWLWRLP